MTEKVNVQLKTYDFEQYLDIWYAGIYEEVEFWTTHIKNRGSQYGKDFDWNSCVSPDKIFELEDDIFSSETKFLDVGSGPYSKCGTKTDKTELSFCSVDPLAYVYKKIKKKYKLETPVTPEFALVEHLDKKFEENEFDMVHMSNALDHSFSPLTGIFQMLYVCRIGGKVILRHTDNEAENENYSGFHQWNCCIRNDEFIIWNRSSELNITEILSEYADVKALNIKDKNGWQHNKIIITKKKASPVYKDEYCDKLDEEKIRDICDSCFRKVEKQQKRDMINKFKNKLKNIIGIKKCETHKIISALGIKIKIRRKQKQKLTTLAIWGWWQGNNLGDNWIKKTMKKHFPYAEFIDTDTMDLNRYGFVVCGGGGLFDGMVIAPWDNIKNIKVPYGMLGLGAEFTHEDIQAQELAKNADFWFVRDKHSLDCMHTCDYERSYDVTFSCPLKRTGVEDLNHDKVYYVYRDIKQFYSEGRCHEKFVEYGKYVFNKDEIDSIIKENFSQIIEDDFQTTADNIDERIKDCGFVISGRYHGIAAAIQKGIPCIALDIYPKNRILMRDAGLEEYCIKLNEIDKLPELIVRAKANLHQIREKQFNFSDKAYSQLEKDFSFAKQQIEKRLAKNMKGLHYGAYWQGDKDIINVMSDDLAKHCNLTKIDLKIYDKKKSKKIKELIQTPNGTLVYIDTKELKQDIRKYKPDFIVLNSAGITLEPEGFEYLKKKNITSVGLAMSDPDVYPYNGKEIAHNFDLFYTNSKYSLQNQYDKNRVNIKLMPFAASKEHHYPMDDVEKIYDVVVVGHARPDRIELINKLKKYCKTGLYGCGWENGLGAVSGIDQVRAINSGKIYLSFAATCAGYENVKIGLFEALACKSCVITKYMKELEDYFEIDKEILCYNTDEELIDKIKYYLENPDKLNAVKEASYKRLLSEHQYENRWRNVISDILQSKSEINDINCEKQYTKSFDNSKTLTRSQKLSAEEWGNLYNQDEVSKVYNAIKSNRLSCQTKEIKKISKKGDKTLEIGCGSCQSSIVLALHGCDAYALDFQQNSLSLGEEAAKKCNTAIKTVLHDATQPLPFKEKEFDIIFHAGLLEHFSREERIKMLSQWRRYCKKMVSMVPNAASLGYRYGKAILEKESKWIYGHETPLYSQYEEFLLAGYTVTDEYTIGETNALYFLDDKHPLKHELQKVWESGLLEDDCRQGYLLITVGVNND